jgi:hypothetical protein
MANTLTAPTGGFQEFGRQEGGSPTAGMTPAWIASTDASIILRGDPIATSSAGGTNLSGNYITGITSGIGSSGIGFIRGIFQGCEQFIPTAGRVVWSNSYNGAVTGSTGDVRCWIIDDPSRNFLVQGSTSAAFTSSFIGLNAGFGSYSSANGTTGLSNAQLLSSTVGSTNTLPFRIVDFYSAYAPPAVPAVGTAAFINGTDNTNVANMVIVRLNNCDRLSLTARSS